MTSDSNVTELRPSPRKGEGLRKPDRTNAERQRRFKQRRKEASNAVTGQVTPAVAHPMPPPQAREGGRVAIATTTAALSLAAVSAGFSITGLTSVFVGSFWPVIGMGVALELGKLSAVAALPTLRHGALKVSLVVLIAVLMGLNAAGCYGFLARAHIGHQVEGDVTAASRAADIETRLALQASLVGDLDRRVAQIDAAVDKATSKGRTAAAMALAEQQRKTRAALVDERRQAASILAGLQVEKAKADGERRKAEADLGPVRYLAALIGADDETVLRWFVLAVALLLDPAAVILLLAASAGRSRSRPSSPGGAG